MIAALPLLMKDWRVIAGIGLVAAFGIWLFFHDRAVVQRHQSKIEAEAAPAREHAAAERVQDAIVNARNERDLYHAISTAPAGGAISPAAHALACERLRRLGRVPAACGPGGGDGAKAGAER